MDEEVTEVFDCIRVTRRYLTRLAIPKVYQTEVAGQESTFEIPERERRRLTGDLDLGNQ